nr:ribonuclease H-like domain-containing protein [Tanacetum cinerariifolium]
SEDDKAVPKLAEARSSKRDTKEELDQVRDDLVQLWSLVKERFSSTEPTDEKERVLWVELKRLFETDDNDELWESRKYIFDITWRLYDTCGVHHVSTKKGMNIYMLVKKEYPLSRAGSESRPPMLNKENYVPWSSRHLRYAKSRPNGKLIHNSILNGPYV